MQGIDKKWQIILLILKLGSFASTMAYADDDEAAWLNAIQNDIGRLSFERNEIDLGQIKQGEKLEFKIPFKEEDFGDVSILGVHMDCGCLSVSLQPGQKISKASLNELLIHVDTSHFIGNLDKNLTILTNEDRAGPHVFRLKARVEQLILVQPPVVELDTSRGSEDIAPIRVRIISPSKQTLHIEKLRYNEDNLEVRYASSSEGWDVLLRWKGPKTLGRIDEVLELVFTSPAMNLKIPLVNRAAVSRLNLSAKP